MKTVEVDPKKWVQFCHRLEEFCRGAMLTIETTTNDGRTIRTVAQEVPLRHLALDDTTDPCNTNLVIEAGSANEKPLRHTIIEPIHIRLKNGNGSDRYNHLQILAETGTTNLRLNPGLNLALLKGLEL